MINRKTAGTVAAVIMAASMFMTACGNNTSDTAGSGTNGSSVVSESEVSSDASTSQNTESTETGTAGSDTGTDSSETAADENSDNIMGQITKVSGNDITITVADSAGAPGNGDAPSKPDGDKPTDDGSKPTDDGSKPTDDGNKPADDGNKPTDDGSKPTDDGNKPKDGGQPGIKLSDESKTVSVNASTTYKLADDSDGALSDLKTDDYVKITMDGDTVVSVTVMDMSSK